MSQRNTPFHQANLALQEEVRRDFQRMRDEVVHSLHAMAVLLSCIRHSLNLNTHQAAERGVRKAVSTTTATSLE